MNLDVYTLILYYHCTDIGKAKGTVYQFQIGNEANCF